ncbi:MAG: hypothetical protein U9N56_07220 [Actinomycetota bacterium]|nr:hypothetical protein [Actinomycetota bacterium]
MSNQNAEESPEPKAGVEWPKLAGVGALAVVLAGIGSLIAANLDELAPPPQPAAAASASSTDTSQPSSPTTVAAVVPSQAAAPSTTTSAAVLDPLVEVSAQAIDLGDASTEATLQISNTGDGPANWSITSSALGLTFSSSAGELASGEAVDLVATLDRTAIEEGEYATTFDVVWDQGAFTISVAATQQDNPVIHNPTATPNPVQASTSSGCNPTKTKISARVRDTSELEEVVVRWSNGSKTVETAMSAVGEDIYEAVIGPFVVSGAAAAKVLAVDIHGNAGGATISITVDPCS